MQARSRPPREEVPIPDAPPFRVYAPPPPSPAHRPLQSTLFTRNVQRIPVSLCCLPATLARSPEQPLRKTSPECLKQFNSSAPRSKYRPPPPPSPTASTHLGSPLTPFALHIVRHQDTGNAKDAFATFATRDELVTALTKNGTLPHDSSTRIVVAPARERAPPQSLGVPLGEDGCLR